MNVRFSRQQQMLQAGILLSDARARQQSEAVALEVIHQYDLILSFLQRIQQILDGYPDLSTFYFPIKSEQLLCVYRTAGLPQPVPVALRSYQENTRVKAQQLFEKTEQKRFLSDTYPPFSGVHPSIEDFRNEENYYPVVDLIRSVLDSELPRPFLTGTSSLVVCCSIPEEIISASSRLRELVGILVLFGDKNSFSEARPDSEKSVLSEIHHSELADRLKHEFDEYVDRTGRFAASHDFEFFFTSLLRQDERLLDNQNRILGTIARMVVHRYRNYRQVAEFIVDEFSTAAKVKNDPDAYEENIQRMKDQLGATQSLEKQIEYAGEKRQKVKQSVRQIVDIFKFVYERKTKGSAITIEYAIPDLLWSEHIFTPHPVLEEIFQNLIENSLKVISSEEVQDKRLLFQIYSEANYICMNFINYGPPLSADVLEDLQRTVRVRHPRGSGLGLFLSSMSMRSTGGDQEIVSPLRNSDRGVCVTLKFLRPS